MPQIIVVCLLALLLASCTTVSSQAQEVVPADDVIGMFVESVNQIRAGSLTYYGQRTVGDASRRVDHEGEVEGAVDFDYGQDLLRFTRKEPNYTGDEMGGQFIRSSDRVISRDPNSRQIAIKKITDTPTPLVSAFDIRTVGICNFAEFDSARLRFEQVFGPDGFLKGQSATVESDGSKLLRVTWLLANGTVRRIIWFDKSAGMTPVRLEESAGRDGNWFAPMNEVDATWVNFHDVWVPSKLDMRWKPNAQADYRLSYSFVWESVNEVLAPSHFSVDAVKAPEEKVKVVDYRLDTPIVVEDPFVSPALDLATSSWTNRRPIVVISVLGVLVGTVIAIKLAVGTRRT